MLVLMQSSVPEQEVLDLPPLGLAVLRQLRRAVEKGGVKAQLAVVLALD